MTSRLSDLQKYELHGALTLFTSIRFGRVNQQRRRKQPGRLARRVFVSQGNDDFTSS